MIGTAVEQMVNEMRAFPFTMIIILALVGYAVYASQNHARAEDIQQLSQQVAKNTSTANKILKLQIAQSLRSLHEQRCKSEDRDTRRTLARTIEELQDDYKELDGARYPLPACA